MRGRTLAMVVLIIANFMDLMDTTVVNVALPSIRTDLGASNAQLEWMVGAYTIGLAAMLVTGGRLGDIVGLRLIFLVGVAGFTLASLGAGIAGTAAILVVSRAFQGGFAGLMVPQVLAGVQVLYPPERRAPIYGMIGLITGLASVVGPLLSGWLITTGAGGFGWRAIFMINVPIGVVLLAVALRVLPAARPGAGARLDLVGAALVTTAVVCLVVPLVNGRQEGWPAWSWLLLAAAPVVSVIFVRRQLAAEREGRTPLIPPHLYRNPAYAAGSVVNFSFQAGLVSLFLVLTLYVQQVLGFSALQSGLVWLGFSIGTLMGSSVISGLPARVRAVLMPIGATVVAAGSVVALGLASAPGSHPAWWMLSLALLPSGIGMGLVIVPLFDASLATVAAADAGAASGALSTVQQIGGALGIAVIGAVFFQVATDQPTPVSMGRALRAASWAAATAFGFAAAAGIALGAAGRRGGRQPG